MDSNKIKLFIVLIIAAFAAVYLGIAAATAQFEAIAWVLGASTLTVCLLLGRKIWLLIPLLGSLNLNLSIPSQPNTLFIAQILVIGFSVMLLLIRKLPYRLVVTELEVWVLITVLLIAQVYLRNPVGLSLFGGDTVGAKPYFIFAITIVSTMILVGLRMPEGDVRTAIRLSILGGLSNFGISVAGRLFPTLGYWSGTNFDPLSSGGSNTGAAIDAGSATRRGFLMEAGTNIALWISAFRAPLLSSFHPVWAPLILLTLAFAGLSGFRSAIALVGLTYAIGIYYRGGFIQLFIAAMVGAAGLVLLALVNVLTPLPPNIQRSLAFLPGTWEQRYLDDAEGSTDWRVEMWQEALTSERWIQNKMFGDGLGFTAQELSYQASLTEATRTRGGMSGFDAYREGVLAAGNYHSVFVSSVRTVGYVGFFIFFIAMLRTAVHANRLIKRYRNTDHFSTCLFFGIPAIIAPIWLPFSALTFVQVASTTLGTIAMLRILQSNLPLVGASGSQVGGDEGHNGRLSSHPEHRES
ncbi:hypothetical protein HZ994_07415 [Akkermansiaceae bacterium]|nr:hypothetical protein HZ994_07415 [Akkermansiaceae bacterium]